MVGEMADALERYFWDVKVLIYHLQRDLRSKDISYYLSVVKKTISRQRSLYLPLSLRWLDQARSGSFCLFFLFLLRRQLKCHRTEIWFPCRADPSADAEAQPADQPTSPPIQDEDNFRPPYYHNYHLKRVSFSILLINTEYHHRNEVFLHLVRFGVGQV